MVISRNASWLAVLICAPLIAHGGDASVPNRWEIMLRKNGISPLQRRAYEQLANDFKGEQLTQWDIVFYLYPKPNPMAVLREMGIHVVPILAKALDDNTPTKTVNRLGTNRKHWKGKVHTWKVNELVALLIRDITNREFVLGEWGDGVHLRELESHRDRIPEFQKQILEWCKRNKDRTPEERKIADLHSNLRNRLDAAAWLGKKKSTEAVVPLANRIETILAFGQDSSTEAELAEDSLALGRIGHPKGYAAVRKACDSLSQSQPRSPGSSAIQDLFKAYEGLAMLGHKKEALAELKRIYEQQGAKMEPLRRKEYQAQLSAAAAW